MATPNSRKVNPYDNNNVRFPLEYVPPEVQPTRRPNYPDNIPYNFDGYQINPKAVAVSPDILPFNNPNKLTCAQDNLKYNQDRSYDKEKLPYKKLQCDLIKLHNDKVKLSNNQYKLSNDQEKLSNGQYKISNCHCKIPKVQDELPYNNLPNDQDKLPYDQDKLSNYPDTLSKGKDKSPYLFKIIPVNSNMLPHLAKLDILPNDQNKLSYNQDQLPYEQDKLPYDQDKLLKDQYNSPYLFKMIPFNSNMLPHLNKLDILPKDQTKLPYDQAKLPYDQAKLPYDQAKIPYDQAKLPYDQTKLPYDQAKAKLHYDQTKLPYDQDQLSYDQDQLFYDQDQLSYDQDQLSYDQDQLCYDQDKLSKAHCNSPYLFKEIPINSNILPHSDKLECKPDIFHSEIKVPDQDSLSHDPFFDNWKKLFPGQNNLLLDSPSVLGKNIPASCGTPAIYSKQSECFTPESTLKRKIEQCATNDCYVQPIKRTFDGKYPNFDAKMDKAFELLSSNLNIIMNTEMKPLEEILKEYEDRLAYLEFENEFLKKNVLPLNI